MKPNPPPIPDPKLALFTPTGDLVLGNTNEVKDLGLFNINFQSALNFVVSNSEGFSDLIINSAVLNGDAEYSMPAFSPLIVPAGQQGILRINLRPTVLGSNVNTRITLGVNDFDFAVAANLFAFSVRASGIGESRHLLSLT